MTENIAKVVRKMYICAQKFRLFMMLKRRILETLRKWKEQPNHLPLPACAATTAAQPRLCNSEDSQKNKGQKTLDFD